jgi:hypothetical protein
MALVHILVDGYSLMFPVYIRQIPKPFKTDTLPQSMPDALAVGWTFSDGSANTPAMKAMKTHIFKTGILAAMLCSCLGCQTLKPSAKPLQEDTKPQQDIISWEPKSKEEAEFWYWVYWTARAFARPEQ